MPKKPTYEELEQKVEKLEKENTEHKQSEDRLREAERERRVWLENSPVCTKIVDRDFNLQFMSSAGIEGLKIDDITQFYGKSYPFDFYPESFRYLMIKNMEEARDTGKIITQEESVIDIDGSELWFHSTIIPVNNDNDQFDYFMIVSIDTTERKQAGDKFDWELQINKSQAELAKTLIDPDQSIKQISEKVLASARDLTASKHGFVSEIDRGTGENVCHALTTMMDKACKFTGVDQRAVIQVGDDGKYPTLRGHALNTGEPFFTNTPLNHPQSSGIPEEHAPLNRFLAVPVKKYDGEIIGLIALANPPSDYKNLHIEAIQRLADLYAIAIHRHRSEEDRIQMEGLLIQAQKMESIGTLAGGVAHDFNNILSPIMIHSEMAMEELPPDSPLQFNLKEIFKAGGRARDLVKQILTFSRKKETTLTKFMITPTLKETIKMLRSTTPATIEITQKIETDNDVIYADPTQIYQVILNLCTNAVHAMKEKGGVLEIGLNEIELDSSSPSHFNELKPGSYLRLRVKDTGHGIDEETLKNIFEPYFTTKGVGEGTGLGLSLIHGIVKDSSGVIIVDSEIGKGTTFDIILPIIESDAPAMKKEKTILQKSSEKILFVDDEVAIVNAHQLMLESLGYQVTARTSSIEALEAFRNNPAEFDLVFTDMAMPNMTGKDLTRKLISIRPDIPIILCTGFSEQIDKDRAKEMGINAFVMKPIVMRDMANTIREVLDKKERRPIRDN